jgi:hypothetical protein
LHLAVVSLQVRVLDESKRAALLEALAAKRVRAAAIFGSADAPAPS